MDNKKYFIPLLENIIANSTEPRERMISMGLVVSKIQSHNFNKQRYSASHRNPISCIKFSDNSHELYSLSIDSTISSYNIIEDKEEFKLSLYADQITAVSLSKNSNFAVFGTLDYKVMIWDIKQYREIGRYSHIKDINCLLFSNDCEYVISGSKDKSIKIWNIKKNKEE